MPIVRKTLRLFEELLLVVVVVVLLVFVVELLLFVLLRFEGVVGLFYFKKDKVKERGRESNISSRFL